MNQPEDEILTLDEVAVYFKAGKKTVYRLAQQGRYRDSSWAAPGGFVARSWTAGLPSRQPGRHRTEMSDLQNDSNLVALLREMSARP